MINTKHQRFNDLCADIKREKKLILVLPRQT
jgi:hypothetical protein